MKPVRLVLFCIGSAAVPFFGLSAQTQAVPSFSQADPLVVSAELSRELEGEKGPQDRLISLEEYMGEVFLKNPAILGAKAELEEAMGEKMVFHSVLYPNVSLGLILGQQGERSTVPVTEAREIALTTGNLSQPLFNATIPASFRRGNVNLIVAQQKFQATVSSTLFQARMSYYNALLSRSVLQLLLELEVPLRENIKLETDRVNTGLSARSSLITAEVRKQQLIPVRETARAGYQGSLVSMGFYMGLDLKNPDSVRLYPKGPLNYMPVSFDLRATTDEALKNRPDLALARNLILLTENDAQIARGGYYPKIDFIVAAQYLPQTILENSNSLDRSKDTRTSEVLLGPGVTWAVIDNGLVTGEVLRQEKIKEGYQIKLEALEQEVPRNLSEIARALDLSQKRIKALASSVKLAEENLKTVQTMISLGQANQLDFVNARNNLFQTKQGMLNAFHQNSLALANLDLAAGRYIRYVQLADRKK